MTRAAIYARYSSDMQSSRSIEDQVGLCRARAERDGLEVVEIYADYAISGASAERPRFRQLIADARAGLFDVILAEALDRLSRDQEHIAGLHKQVTFAGVRIVTIAEGDISELHIGLKGTMSALFLKDLAQKTHRGLSGRVKAGGSGGGLSFGYQVRRGLQPDGTPIAGALDIVPEQASVIRRIFEGYVAGRSPRSIAKVLNAEQVPGPRGGRWTASLLLGNAQRETGILRNRLYVGERVWNRQHFLKDPNTGRRVARLNPAEAWILAPAPDLAFLDRELWEAAQARLRDGRRLVTAQSKLAQGSAQPSLGARLGSARRPKWPLAGLVRCGVCNGPMSVVANGGRLGCANHTQRGTCDNRRTILRDAVLARVLVELKERLLAPELVETFARAYVEEVNTANRERGARQASLSGQQAKLDRQIRNLLDLIKDGHGSPAMVEELRALERQREGLQEEMARTATPEPVPTLHPNLPALYRRRVEALEEALQDEATSALAGAALCTLIDAILVTPGARRGEVSLSLRGDLAAFLGAGEAERAPESKTAALRVQGGRVVGVMGSLVAGIGFEPMTFRL